MCDLLTSIGRLLRLLRTEAYTYPPPVTPVLTPCTWHTRWQALIQNPSHHAAAAAVTACSARLCPLLADALAGVLLSTSPCAFHHMPGMPASGVAAGPF
jgi:hypothetical protein